MKTQDLRTSHVSGLPFYIFVSLLLAVVGGAGTVAAWRAQGLALAALCAVLFLGHIGIHWLSYRGMKSPLGWVGYYIVQSVLVIALSLFPYGNGINTTVMISLLLSMIGETLGLWGNTARTLLIGGFFAAMAFALLYYLVDAENFGFAASSMLFNGGLIVLFMAAFNQQLTERQKAIELAESLESANAKLAAYNAKIESLTLQNERQRMARELHDTLAQGVAGLVLQLEAVKAHLASDRKERASAIVEQSIARARSTLAESRAAIDDLRAASGNAADSVREKIERFTQATGIPCESEISVNENQLFPETVNHALNILSESLTNIARHAQATQVQVKFIAQGQTLELEARDNGKGFDVSQNVSGHYGLIGMHERARLTGGQIAVESNQNGTCVQFVVGRS